MMQKNTKKLAPILCAAIVIVILGLYMAVILFAALSESLGEVFAVILLLIVAGILIAAIVGVVAALRQRLKEIDKGEEEDAKIY